MKFHAFRSADGPYIDHRYRRYSLEKYLTFRWYSNTHTRFLKSTNRRFLLVQSILADSRKRQTQRAAAYSDFAIDRRGMQTSKRKTAASRVRRGYAKTAVSTHRAYAYKGVSYVREKWV